MAKGKLKKAGASRLAAKIRKAVGAGPNEDVQFVTPQFTRLGGQQAGPAPKTPAAWAKLAKLTPAELKSLGLRRWGQEHDDHGGPMLWLFPGEWYAAIPRGHLIVDLNFCERKFEPGKTDNDIRFGCLAYGFLRDD